MTTSTSTVATDAKDRLAILDLLGRLALLLDARDWTALEHLFTDTVYNDRTSLTGGQPVNVSAAEFFDGWRQTLQNLNAVHHLITSHVISLDGDEATCGANMQGTHVFANASGGPVWTVGGRHGYQLNRTPDGWRIAGLTFTVDIHHMLPDFFWQATNEGDNPVGGIAPPPWSLAGALEFLDEAGIDVAVTSISTPGVHTGDDAAARALARRCNELAATQVREHPDRFAAFAALPLADVDGGLAELEYALGELHLDGVVLFSNARGVYLGDRRFDPLFEELQRRAAVVFIHQNASPDPAAHALGLPDSLIDFTSDTTRAVAHMHYSNTFARTPDVKYVISHAGGTVPYLAGRFGIVDAMDVIPGAADRASAADTFRRLYWDTALSWTDPVLRHLRSAVGIDHVVFGTDYPYLRHDMAVDCRQQIEHSEELTDAERRAVLSGTALKLIPRLAALRARAERSSSRPRSSR